LYFTQANEQFKGGFALKRNHKNQKIKLLLGRQFDLVKIAPKKSTMQAIRHIENATMEHQI